MCAWWGGDVYDLDLSTFHTEDEKRVVTKKSSGIKSEKKRIINFSAHDVCMMCAWCVYDVCMMCVWCVSTMSMCMPYL